MSKNSTSPGPVVGCELSIGREPSQPLRKKNITTPVESVQFPNELAQSIKTLESLGNIGGVDQVERAMDKAQAIFQQMKSVGDSLVSAYNEILDLQEER